ERSYIRCRLISCRQSEARMISAGVTTIHDTTTLREKSAEYLVMKPTASRTLTTTIQRTTTRPAIGGNVGKICGGPLGRERGGGSMNDSVAARNARPT